MPLPPEMHISGGMLYAYLFENAARGVERQLFWNLIFECAPLEAEGDRVNCSILCDWMQWPVRRWTALDGQHLGSMSAPHKVEGSLYLGTHEPLVLKEFQLRRLPSTAAFTVSLEAIVDVEGFGHLDGRGMRIAATGEAQFKHLILMPENVVDGGATIAELSAIADQHLSLADFGPPEWDRFRYIFEPLAAAV